MGDEAEPVGKPNRDADRSTPTGEPAATRGKLSVAQLVRDYHQAVYRYAFRLVGSAADAEDLTQQTFLIAQQKLLQIRDPSKADRWLLAVVRSCFLKNRRRRRPTSAANLDMNMEDVPVEQPVDDEVDRERLGQALDELPDPYRVVLGMFYFEELSYKEIAAELDVPIGTVMSRLARAKVRLRQQLACRV